MISFEKFKRRNFFLLAERTRYPRHCSSSNSASNQKLASRGRKERSVGIVWRRWRGGGVQRKWLPRKRAARRNRTVFQDEWSLRKGEASAVQAVSDARFGQRSFIRMQLRPRLLLGSTCDHVATGNRATATAVPASLYPFLQASTSFIQWFRPESRGPREKDVSSESGASHFRSC